MITRQHRIDPISRQCLGCALPSGQAKLTPDCPAYYRQLSGLSIIVTTDERLILLPVGTGPGLRLDQGEMFEVRDAIDEGVRDLREGGRSTAAPA